MDQKNTIVKCKAHPNCLFNHNGICDNYVINIDVDGKCKSYIETELSEHSDTTFLMTMKVAKFNAPNKNKSTVKDVVPECDLPVCNWSCKHALRSGPTFNPEFWCDKMKAKPAVGLFCSDYKEEK